MRMRCRRLVCASALVVAVAAGVGAGAQAHVNGAPDRLVWTAASANARTDLAAWPTPVPTAMQCDASDRLRPNVATTPLQLAQRALDPAWHSHGDSLRTPRAPGQPTKKSPGLAIAMAAVVPGTGQIYLGHRHGYVQLGTEVVAWLSYLSLHKSGADKQTQYKSYTGNATASTIADANHWQFDRYCPTTSDCDTTDYNDLLRQWSADRTRFYESITDTRYVRGWTDATARAHYLDLRKQSNRFLRLSRNATAVVVINHVISLIDAVHATKTMRLSAAPPRPLQVEWAFDPLAPAGPAGRAALTFRFGR